MEINVSKNIFLLESNNTWTGVEVESVEASASCVTLWRTARFCYFLVIVPNIASWFSDHIRMAATSRGSTATKSLRSVWCE